MLFNSFPFAIFFLIVTPLYFYIPHPKRWALLLFASCIFYMYFVPYYILILLFIILVDYGAGIGIEKSRGRLRKACLIASLSINVGVLFFFKYFNFMNHNLAELAGLLHFPYPIKSLPGILLPIGLSFHTFQSMSYTIEVYRGNQKAERHLGIYALYVMFYPQLVAGPIERPQNLLHQFKERHEFDPARVFDGLKLMLLGFLKKIVIADRLAAVTEQVFNDPSHYSGAPLLIATYFFTFQIFCDFSGYTDIARGAARVMGFELMKNFKQPYLSRSIGEFWRRWHISLSTWFKDYLYIPLGGGKASPLKRARNILIVFLVSGLWHGANWTFVAWGALHGLALIATTFLSEWKKVRMPPFLSTLLTFHFVAFSWIFFRANSIGDAFYIVTHLFKKAEPYDWASSRIGATWPELWVSGCLISLLMAWEYLGNLRPWGRFLSSQPLACRWSVYYTAIFCLIFLGQYKIVQFIYFQF